MIKQLFTVFGLLAASDEWLKEVSAPIRPQEPKTAISYDTEEVKYSNLSANVTLAGTLTLPSAEKPSPAVLLIAGSGPNEALQLKMVSILFDLRSNNLIKAS